MSEPDIRKIDRNMDFKTVDSSGMDWFSVDDEPLVFEGLYWRKKDGEFRRVLPEYSISPYIDETLSFHTSGAMLRFITDADEIRIDVKLHKNARMDHMASTGSMGFDLYCGCGSSKRLCRTARFSRDVDEYCVPVFELGEREHGEREFTLHFPLYCGVKSFRIGFKSGSVVKAPSPWCDPRPIVVYGTSIQQGGCASRPGMSHTNIMSRMLNRPFINLGFSGSGKGQPSAARMVAAVENPAMFILDYSANAKNDGLRETLSEFITILRSAHPETPILLVSRTKYIDEHEGVGYTGYRLEQTVIYQDELRRRREAGDKNIHFLDGMSLYGELGAECTVDGVHATDLGFYMTAKHMAPVIAEILGK